MPAAPHTLPQAAAGRSEGLDLDVPEIDFVALSKSFGVEAYRVTEPDELAERVRDSPLNRRLCLFDVPISRTPQSRLNYG
ncbi:MAG: hypothetical protein R3C99_26270 [Pirellulaceae bacterium]